MKVYLSPLTSLYLKEVSEYPNTIDPYKVKSFLYSINVY